MRRISFLFLLASACSAAPKWEAISNPNQTLVSDARFSAATSIKSDMVSGLTTKLGEAITESGPSGAIEVCQTLAPAAAQAMQEKTGARIGRTSYKLRNPKNTPPAWLEATVAEAAALAADDSTPKASPEILAWRGPAGQLAVAFPLPLKGKCLACHGPKAELAETTLAVLADKYPTDQATGFNEGDLRGWLWIELPASE